MEPRLNPYKLAPALVEGLRKVEDEIKAAGLEASLIELVKIRASQINGCALCLHMHTSDALKQGESARRLFLLDAWHESNLFSARERAALAWTEALTLVARTRAPDSAYEGLLPHFAPEEIAQLTFQIMTINAWNRLAIGLRLVHPHDRAEAA